MKSSRLGLLVVLVSLTMAAPALADDTTQSPVPITDPAQVSEHYRQIVARPEFQGDAGIDIGSQIQETISQWFAHLLTKFDDFKYASQMPIFTSLLMTILVLLVVIGLLYVIVRLTRRSGIRDLEPAMGVSGQKTFLPPESYDLEIREALGSGDWHRAWLAAWRQFLSRLESRQLVEADRTRTNREYLAQLRDKSLPASALGLLTEMVDGYDRFIYGRKSIGEPEWNQFHQKINEAGLMLHLDDKHHGQSADRGAA